MSDATAPLGSTGGRTSQSRGGAKPTPLRLDYNGEAGRGYLLSIREREVLRLISYGLTNKEIAQNLRISPETIKSHIKHMFRKLAVDRRAQAVALGYSLGLIGESGDA